MHVCPRSSCQLLMLSHVKWSNLQKCSWSTIPLLLDCRTCSKVFKESVIFTVSSWIVLFLLTVFFDPVILGEQNFCFFSSSSISSSSLSSSSSSPSSTLPSASDLGFNFLFLMRILCLRSYMRHSFTHRAHTETMAPLQHLAAVSSTRYTKKALVSLKSGL